MIGPAWLGLMFLFPACPATQDRAASRDEILSQAWLPKAPPLPPASDPIVRVATVRELFEAVKDPAPGTTILLADGVYEMPRLLELRTDRLTLRGASGNRSKVVLEARNSRHGEIVWITSAEDVTIANLTIQNAKWNGFKINSNSGVQRLRIYNCVIRNIWQRGVKGVSVPARDREKIRPRGCRIEYCLFVNDRPKKLEDDADDIAQGNYIAGIDVMYADEWVVRRNVFVGIQGKTGEGRAAIFFWFDTRRTRIEENVIIDCDHGISIGNPSKDDKTRFHAVDCRVENNFMTRTREGGVFAAYTKDCAVRFNTIYEPSGRWGRLLRAHARNEGLTVENNLLTGSQKPLNVPESALRGNVLVHRPRFFAAPRLGDLHLRGKPAEVVDRAAGTSPVATDIDGERRTGPADVGADEHSP